MNQNYAGLFENWEIGVATKVIREFKAQWKWLQRIDEEDLLQECLTHWLFRRKAQYVYGSGCCQQVKGHYPGAVER
jgi:hypothetical protein